MNRVHTGRLLRICWLAACVVVCLLLTALWVRSYWWMDTIGGPLSPTRILLVTSIEGELLVQVPFHDWGYVWNVKHTSLSPSSPTSSVFGSGFRFLGDSVCLPVWPIITLFAAFAIAPWLRWRFSLRTLLVATTAVAVVLGVIVWRQ